MAGGSTPGPGDVLPAQPMLPRAPASSPEPAPAGGGVPSLLLWAMAQACGDEDQWPSPTPPGGLRRATSSPAEVRGQARPLAELFPQLKAEIERRRQQLREEARQRKAAQAQADAAARQQEGADDGGGAWEAPERSWSLPLQQLPSWDAASFAAAPAWLSAPASARPSPPPEGSPPLEGEAAEAAAAEVAAGEFLEDASELPSPGRLLALSPPQLLAVMTGALERAVSRQLLQPPQQQQQRLDASAAERQWSLPVVPSDSIAGTAGSTNVAARSP